MKDNFQRAKVLIIEDNDDHWLLIQVAMQQCLSEVALVRAATYQQALTLLTEWDDAEWELPKLILLDLYLPTSQEGWQLLDYIKGLSTSFRQIPIIMLSASSNNNDIIKAYQLGISSYLVKPVDAGEWLTYFRQIREYWWETTTLPLLHYTFQ